MVRAQDYWLIEDGYRRAMAKGKLERLMDVVLTNNAEGEARRFKYTGEEVQPDPQADTVKLEGLTRRQNELRAEANMPLITDAPNNMQLLMMMRRDIARKREEGAGG